MGRAEVSCYTVYPDGYDESTIGDKRNWILYVERMLQEDDSYLWKIARHRGQSRDGFVLTRTGKWIIDSPRQRRWTRHTLEDALALAEKAVETAGPMGWTLQQFEEHFAKREAATT